MVILPAIRIGPADKAPASFKVPWLLGGQVELMQGLKVR
jgi:hypothetical protein